VAEAVGRGAGPPAEGPRVRSLRHALHSRLIQSTDAVAEYFNALARLREEYQEAGGTVSDNDLNKIVIYGLTNRFHLLSQGHAMKLYQLELNCSLTNGGKG
jgi:glucuronate isomerase